MKVDTGVMAPSLADIGPRARELEQLGYDGLLTAETGHDAFLPIALAAEHTERIELATGIAVAFARTPMVLAYTANDLQQMSKGRFSLGLGSQIKPHIEKRFSMPWSHPARRMREYILALQAIWTSWNEQTPLKFDGEFYKHTLMTPFFAPTPNPYGPPKVFLAAVGELMTEVAGGVDDEILDTFAVVADPEGVGAELKRRYGGVVDRCSFYAPYRTDPARWTKTIEDLKQA